MLCAWAPENAGDTPAFTQYTYNLAVSKVEEGSVGARKPARNAIERREEEQVWISRRIFSSDIRAQRLTGLAQEQGIKEKSRMNGSRCL
jgi:hypothetical protein